MSVGVCLLVFDRLRDGLDRALGGAVVMFLAQVVVVGAVVAIGAVVLNRVLTPRWERAISRALDFEQK